MLLILIPLYGCPQNVKVSGIIIGGNKTFPDCTITINDTILKVMNTFKHKPRNWFSNLYDNENLCTFPEEEGFFEISAKLSDTLYFREIGYKTQKHSVRELIKKNSIVITLEPKKCVPLEECNKEQNLHAIVAKKISVKYQEPKVYCDQDLLFFNTEYLGKYKILENIYGEIKKDTIQFLAYDHYSDPKFAYYDNVLIYVIEACGDFYHSKYLFHDLHKTIDGKWASPSVAKYYGKFNKEIEIKPKPIKYLSTVKYFFDKEISEEELNEMYPKQYFEHNDGYVIAKYGNYIPELFEFMKQTVLKARGHFD